MALGPNPTAAELAEVDDAIKGTYLMAESSIVFILDDALTLARYTQFINNLSTQCHNPDHHHNQISSRQAREDLVAALAAFSAALHQMEAPRNGWEALAEHSLTHDPEGI